MVRDSSRSRSSSAKRSRSRSLSKSRQKRRRRSRSSRSTFSRTPSPGAKRLHIGNLDDTVRRCDIEDVFGKYGRIVDCWMASYPPFYGFVVFDRAEDAQKALRDMSTGYIKDCRVRTTVALPRYGGHAGRASNRGRLPPPPVRPRRHFDDYGRGMASYGRRRRSRSRSVRRRRPSPSLSRSRSVSPKRTKHRRSISNDKEEFGKNNGNENFGEGSGKKNKREKRSMSRSSNNSSNNGRQRLRRSSHSSKSD
jgi:hypothetical protein